MEVIALFSVGLIRIYICVMVFDKEGFIRVVLDFLSASVKNASEIEGCWNEMQQCINNMDRTVQSFAFAQWEQDKVDMEELPLPHPLDLGTGRCSSTIVKPNGCGATIKSRQELLQGKKRKWINISSQQRNMLAKPSPMNDSFYVCTSCYWHESKRLSDNPLRTVPIRTGMSG